MIPLLFRHLFESTVFCLVLGAVAFCLQRRGAAARYTAWLIGISKFAVPTSLLAATGARIAFFLPATSFFVPATSWISSMAVKLSAVLAIAFARLPEITASAAIFLTIWLIGAIAMLLAWLLRLRKSYFGLTGTSSEEEEALERARRRFGIHTPLRLRSSEAVREPSLLGILQPIVTIPNGLSNTLSAEEFETVLLHELAHARRRDNLTAAFVHCLVCIFWFHPLLWLVEKRLIAERERACDEMVIASGAAPHTYIAGILKVCKFHVFESVAGVSAMSASDLKARLDLIAGYQFHSRLSFAPRFLLAAFSVLMTMVPVAGGYCQQCVSNGQGYVRSKALEVRALKRINHHVRER